MKPIDFCHQLGFTLESEAQPEGHLLIHVIDQERSLYPSGKKEGSFPIPPKILKWKLERGYDALMNLILDKVFD